MSGSFTTAAVMYALAAPTASAQAVARPNYSGTWLLDASKNEASAGPGPSAITWNIQQHGDTLITDREATTDNGVVKSHMVVGIDGKPWKNTVPQPGVGDVEVSSVAAWETGGVVVRTSGNFQGTDFIQIDRWTLSADGKTLVSHRSVTVQEQEVQSATFTFNKKN